MPPLNVIETTDRLVDSLIVSLGRDLPAALDADNAAHPAEVALKHPVKYTMYGTEPILDYPWVEVGGGPATIRNLSLGNVEGDLTQKIGVCAYVYEAMSQRALYRLIQRMLNSVIAVAVRPNAMARNPAIREITWQPPMIPDPEVQTVTEAVTYWGLVYFDVEDLVRLYGS